MNQPTTVSASVLLKYLQTFQAVQGCNHGAIETIFGVKQSGNDVKMNWWKCFSFKFDRNLIYRKNSRLGASRNLNNTSHNSRERKKGTERFNKLEL